MGRLYGRVSLVTGSGRGIGKATALRFAEEGSIVIGVDVDPAGGESTAAEIRAMDGESIFIEADVSHSNEVQEAVHRVRERYGRLDVLLNNASVFLPAQDGRVVDIDEGTWDRILAVNLKSIYLCCKHGIPLMLENGGGSIINTSSSAGLIGIPGCDAYTASKGATISLTRSLAVEYRPQGIRVNCIAPAAVQTPMMGSSNLDDSTFDEPRFLGLRTPSRRYGTAQEIAGVAAFLASDDASYVNGAVLVADGGVTVNGDLAKMDDP